MPAPQKTIRLKPVGLYSYPNQYSAPAGAMSTCSDIFIDRPGVIEAARKWYQPYNATTLGSFDGLDNINQLYGGTTFADLMVQQTGHLLVPTPHYTWGHLLSIYQGGAAVDWGDPGGRLTSSFYANSNTYLAVGGSVGENYIQTTGPALLRSEASGSFKARGCGMPEAPTPVSYTATAFGALGGLPAPTAGKTWGASADLTQQRAYRVLFAYKDANGNLVRGAPSGRFVVYNPAADFSMLIIGTDRLLAGDIVQLYASELQPTSASTPPQSVAAEPTDLMRLVFEHIVVAADITNGYFACQDISPDSMRGAELYTNATQDGILLAEQPPPPSTLTDYFKNVAWYAGTSWAGYSKLTLNIIGLNGWSGTAPQTTITVNGATITAQVTEDLVGHKFVVYGNGTPSQNLINTANSICRALNFRNYMQGLAVYITPPNSSSITILFKIFNWNTGFTPTRSSPSTFITSSTNLASGTTSPDISSTQQSSYDTTPARLYFSKPGQPEAVPELNYVVVGNPSCPITGITHIRDSLFVFKTDGLFMVTGTTLGTIQVTSFDETVKLPPGNFRTIAKAGNQIFAFCNQGVISVTESGVSIISEQISDILFPYLNSNIKVGGISGGIIVDRFRVSGAASDSESKYFLQLISETGNFASNEAAALDLAYNYINRSWTLKSTSTAPGSLSGPIHIAKFAPPVGPEQMVEVGFSGSAYGLVRIGNVDAVASPYSNSSTWTYVFQQEEYAGMLKQFFDVKVVTLGSGAINQISLTFSSDSGAAPSTVTVTPYDSTICNVEVPKEHAMCSSLQIQITGPTSGGNFFAVSEVQTNFDIISDWSVK